MVKKVNGPSGKSNVPNGYTKIKLYDKAAKKVETFFVPVGKKFRMNGVTYDPSKGKNNELVITGKKGQAGFDNAGIALEHMDVNGDGRIDKKDTSNHLAESINKTLNKKGSEYYVKSNDTFSDAGIINGSGGVVFSKDGEQRMEFNIE